MKKQLTNQHLLKVLGWSLVAALLLTLALMAQPSFLDPDNGVALAQSGGEGDKDGDNDDDDKGDIVYICSDGSQVINDPAHCPSSGVVIPSEPAVTPPDSTLPCTHVTGSPPHDVEACEAGFASTTKTPKQDSNTTILTHNGGKATVHLPNQEANRTVNLTSVDPSTVGASNPGQAIVLDIKITDADGNVITSHEPCPTLRIDVPLGFPSPFQLFRQDSAGIITEITGTFDPATRVFTAELCNTSTFFLQPQVTNSDTYAAPETVIPAGLPRTGTANATLPVWSIIAVGLGSIIAGYGVWRWRG